MNSTKQSKWMAVLCIAAFAGCASDKWPGGSSSGANTGYTAPGGADSQTAYGTVQAIDQMQRQDVGMGTIGAAAAGGTIAGSPTDRVYRVTVRLDDGSSQLVVVDAMPSYKIGDRVRYNNGTLTSY